MSLIDYKSGKDFMFFLLGKTFKFLLLSCSFLCASVHAKIVSVTFLLVDF